MPAEPTALVESPLAVLTVLLAVLAALFTLDRHPLGARLFKRVPLLVFCYFVPTLLSNTGVIPVESELYTFVRACSCRPACCCSSWRPTSRR